MHKAVQIVEIGVV